MIWFGAILIIIFVDLWIDHKNKSVDTSRLFLVGAIVIACVLANVTIGSILSKEGVGSFSDKPDNTVEIASLDTVSGVSGTFMLGSGSIGNVAVYYYYERTDDGGYRLGSLEADGEVVIYQNDSETPRIETYESGTGLPWVLLSTNIHKTKYNIYLPDDSIIQQYNPSVR